MSKNNIENLVADLSEQLVGELTEKLTLCAAGVRINGAIDWDIADALLRVQKSIAEKDPVDDFENVFLVGMFYRLLAGAATTSKDAFNWLTDSENAEWEAENYYYFSMIKLGFVEGISEKFLEHKNWEEEDVADLLEGGLDQLKLGLNLLKDSNLEYEYLSSITLLKEGISYWEQEFRESGYSKCLGVILKC